jgi:hypothetical protein
VRKYLFELEEVCFGENDICNPKQVDKFIQDLLNIGFHCSDDEKCDKSKNEFRVCLHHLEGANDEDLGYYWLKFKIHEKKA